MVIDLASVDPATLDGRLKKMVQSLNSTKWQPVLVFNQYSGSGRPAVFMVETAQFIAGKGKVGEDKPFVSLNASGPVYELTKGGWVPDRFNQWGRNFLAEGKGSYIAVGPDEIAKILQLKLDYRGGLPKDF